MKKSFISGCMAIALVALMASCGGKKAEPTAEASENAATTEVAAEETAPAEEVSDVKSIVGFNVDDLKFEGIVSAIDVEDPNDGKQFTVHVTPSERGDANFNAFSKALFEKIKSVAGTVYNGYGEERAEPYTGDAAMSVFTYEYKVNGERIYATLSSVDDRGGNDYSVNFSK